MSTLDRWLKHWDMYESIAYWYTEGKKKGGKKESIPLCSFFKFPSLHRLHLWVVVGHEKTPPLNRLWNGYRNNNVLPPHAFKKERKNVVLCDPSAGWPTKMTGIGMQIWLTRNWNQSDAFHRHQEAALLSKDHYGMAMIFNVTLHSILAPFSLSKRKKEHGCYSFCLIRL